MSVPCVAVPREEGETTRRRLAEVDLIDDAHEIVHENGTLYIPVVDADAVPADLRVVERDAPTRESQTMPADLLEADPSMERLGDIAILHEDDADRAAEIADAIVASDLPIRTVINRASKIKGELRVREWVVLACQGDHEGPCTETVHREYGHEFRVDLAEVYFSPRLATERNRVVQQVDAGEHAFDMFAGVGPFVIPFADRGAEVVGVDLNEVAVEYLRENARRNGVADRVTAIQGDVREIAPDYQGWAERIVMNLPHSAEEFVETAVSLASDECTLHYYDIQHEDDPFGPGRRAIEEAVGNAYGVEVETERVVRSYAPHELNVCLDVRLTQ